jgi:nitrogenase molybdenum-iron protein beta chain
MDAEATVIFEIESFDSPLMPDKSGHSHGSTTCRDLSGLGDALGTIALNRYEGGKAADYLAARFGQESIVGPTPIGIRNTDIFLKNVQKLTGKAIPQSLVRYRGVAIDALADLTHMFLADKKVAIYGNPDLAIGLAQFCLDLEMKPVLVLLGDDNSGYATDPRLTEMIQKVDFDMQVITNADLFDLESRIKSKEVELDLILGHSKGRFVAIDNHIPMLRVGFPTYDRAGLYRYPIMGYAGAAYLAESMANTLFADMEYKENKEWLLNVW